MKSIAKILFCVPNTIWFNLRYLPLKQALRLPVWIAPNVRVKCMWRGGFEIKTVAPHSIKIGFHEADGIDTYGQHTVLDIHKGGKMIFAADAHIGHGAILHIGKDAEMHVGRNFAVSGTTSFICNNRIFVGEDAQFSWDSYVMDSSAHTIYPMDGSEPVLKGEIHIGDHVWVSARVTLTKGAAIPDNSVVAACSLVNKPFTEPNTLYAGIPARPLKPIRSWHI